MVRVILTESAAMLQKSESHFSAEPPEMRPNVVPVSICQYVAAVCVGINGDWLGKDAVACDSHICSDKWHQS